MYAIAYSQFRPITPSIIWYWTGTSEHGTTKFTKDIEDAYAMDIDDAELTLAGIGFPFHTFPDNSEVVRLSS